MSSTATVLVDEPGAVVVRVDHLDTDSFSRSVNRAANRAWRGSAHARTATYTSGLYGLDNESGNPRACHSIVAYGKSFDHARLLATLA